MTPAEQACAFVLLVAQAEPDPGNKLDRQAINSARRIARRLHADGAVMIRDLPPPRSPVAATGVPITRRTT